MATPLKRVWIPSPNYSSRGGAGVRLIVVHTAEGARTIESLGSYFQGNVEASSHTGADDKTGTIGEYVKRSNKAWTQGNFNPVAVAIELCGFAAWDTAEWDRHPAMLDNCARWIAEEAAHYGIPITKLNANQAQGSGRGVCGHNELGSAGGGHWDPGPSFPWNRVLDLARGDTTTTPDEDGNMIGASLAANGALHVFEADGKDLGYTWQKAGDTAWQGGTNTPAGFAQFATAPARIVGVTAALTDVGNLHVFVKCDNGKTYYTWQRKGDTAWAGGQAGKTVAGLSPFA
jgi:N-acetyl-anhydromuramyl-L-alanine amidase AmpD